MRWARFSLFVALSAIPSPAAAQGDPVGPEFRVNTYTANTQRNPSVAADASGSFVVVWGSYQDGSLYGVFGQRYDGSGFPTGPEFRVNTYTTFTQNNPAVATAASGAFVVVWQSVNQDGSGYGVFGQRYDGTGAPLGLEFRVNTSATGSEYRPSVAADSLGNFVVVWQVGGGFGVFGQRYASAGAPLGPEFRVNTSPSGVHWRPSVASDPSGNFIVVYERQLSYILGQRYSNSGAPLGSEFIVAAPHHLEWMNTFPSVASDSSGNVVVVWTGGDTNFPPPWDVYGRRYSSSGAPASGEFRVNTYAANNQDDPAVAADSSGNFVVVWRSAGQDGYSYGIFGQRYLGSGAALGPEFRVNTYTTHGQTGPAVAVDPAGNFIVAWNSDTQDGSAAGIFGQRYNMIVPVELMHFRVE
jgi:hypothetical protein